ncbi:MAG: MBL fold metallo-hydrolase [Candidatus Eremiobacteraeota bacterium]|nr:MBL fold metallo-hydrolase [Candidatus Eremiobacteraeota bacterium]
MLRTRDAAVLLDLGSGALGNLRLTIDYPRIDAVIVSHMHADHFLDLIPLRYGLKYGPSVRGSRMALWLPPGGARMLRTLCAAFAPESPADFLDEVFEVGEYDPAVPLDVNDLRLRFAKTRHYVDTYAMRAERDNVSIVYSGDTAPCDEVVELARSCTLFLCEATLGLGNERGRRGHLSAEEAGQLAERAGVDQLVLTHYSTSYSPHALVRAAQGNFFGRVGIADDGDEHVI